MKTINLNISIGIKSLNKWNAYLRHILYDTDGDMISTKASFVDKTAYDMWNDYNGIWFSKRSESIKSGKYNGIWLVKRTESLKKQKYEKCKTFDRTGD